MIYKISSPNQKEWQGKKFTEAELINSNGELFKVSAWAGEFDGKLEIDTELEKNEKGYWKLKKAQTPRSGAFQAIKKVEIAEAQATKAQNIALAQDRSAWMWAKTNATTLISSPNLRDGEVSSAEEMVDKVIAIATKIYNAEPLAPFN